MEWGGAAEEELEKLLSDDIGLAVERSLFDLDDSSLELQKVKVCLSCFASPNLKVSNGNLPCVDTKASGLPYCRTKEGYW